LGYEFGTYLKTVTANKKSRVIQVYSELGKKVGKGEKKIKKAPVAQTLKKKKTPIKKRWYPIYEGTLRLSGGGGGCPKCKRNKRVEEPWEKGEAGVKKEQKRDH